MKPHKMQMTSNSNKTSHLHSSQINCSSASCSLNEVKYSSEANLEKHDSLFYQCVVIVKEGSGETVKTVGTFYSNVLAVDVQSG